VCGAGINGAGVGRTAASTVPALAGSPGTGAAVPARRGGNCGGRCARRTAGRHRAARAGCRTTSAPHTARVVQGLHFGELEQASIHGLCPLLFAVAETGDEVAQGVVDRFVEEVGVLTRWILRRLELTGGGAGGDPRRRRAHRGRRPVIAEMSSAASSAPKRWCGSSTSTRWFGAALFGLDALGGDGRGRPPQGRYQRG